MAWVAEVLDDLLGLPVTPGAVGVLEGRQCAPGDVLGRPHHPLESLAVADGAVPYQDGTCSLCSFLKSTISFI